MKLLRLSLLLLLPLAVCAGCTPPAKSNWAAFPYDVGPGLNRFSFEQADEASFARRTYPSGQEDVAHALLDVVSQRCAVVGASRTEELVLTVGHCHHGIQTAALLAIGLREVAPDQCLVAVAWIDPFTGRCASIPAETPATASERRSHRTAREAGQSILSQVATHLYGPQRWEEKFFR